MTALYRSVKKKRARSASVVRFVSALFLVIALLFGMLLDSDGYLGTVFSVLCGVSMLLGGYLNYVN